MVHLDENIRQGGARNVGLEYAQADYIGYVDGDDWLESAMYERLYQCMKEYNCDIVDCRMRGTILMVGLIYTIRCRIVLMLKKRVSWKVERIGLTDSERKDMAEVLLLDFIKKNCY